jgi:EpsI family protein
MGGTEKNAIYLIVFALIVGGIAHGAKRFLSSDHPTTCRIPASFGSWNGSDVECDRQSLRSVLGAQEIVFRSYGSGMDAIVLYIAFYKDVDSADNVHSPKVCYAGQGWMVMEDDNVRVRMGRAWPRVNRLVIRKAGKQELVYNWWQTGGRVIPRNSLNRFFQMFLSITGRDPSTVWVRVSKQVNGEMGPEEERMMRFMDDLMPCLEPLCSGDPGHARAGDQGPAPANR